MKHEIRKLLPLLILVLLLSCTKRSENFPSDLSSRLTAEDVQTHITYLADDRLKGRETGTAGEAQAANYIADLFHSFGLRPAGDRATFFQEFTVNRSRIGNPHRSDSDFSGAGLRIARNVAGLIEGTLQPDRYIIIGAHYDHLGLGSFGSLSSEARIHNGADDNASGTAGLLELAHYFSQNPPERSLLFIAFSGEEMGLLGSRHFVMHPTIPLEQTLAMINMDMIGRMDQDKLIIYGTGSSNGWDKLLEQVSSGTLSITAVPDGTGASDHTSFYNKGIPVLHYFTDTHADYHRPSDDTRYINFEGTSRILDHVRRVISALDTLPEDELAFTQAPSAPHQDMTLSGVTLGVTPDYGFEGKGLRITGVRSNGPADRAGLQSGDVIIRLNGKDLENIYQYMEVLNKLEKGDESSVTVRRDGQELTFELTL